MKVSNTSSSADNLYTERLKEWTNREVQLNRLHEELVAKREALVHYSMTYVESQRLRHQTVQVHVNNSTKRNNDFLEDLQSTDDKLYEESCNPPSPRLTTLQNNYWAMVKSLKPLWEKSLQKKSNLVSKKTSSRTSTRPTKPKRVVKK